jgi:hypothetical protein
MSESGYLNFNLEDEAQRQEKDLRILLLELPDREVRGAS